MLLSIAALSAVAYGWRIGSSIEIYYAAAVRSMSMSWHDFAFAAFDPAGTVSIDKLPGAFWLQALSVRLFGVHAWAVALPQVVEGVLAVLVLYRAVRRLSGPVAGLVAALVLAASPAVVALDRGNISDSLLIVLLVLAADAVAGALTGGGWGSLVLAGLWVGLAFQAKMLEAWLVVPALVLAYLVAGPVRLGPRLLRTAVLCAVVVVVSLGWMVVVSLTPAAGRPYVDGSSHDSLFEQVFSYNGLGRVGQPSPNAQAGLTLGIPALRLAAAAPGGDRLLTGAFGRDIGWLLPAAVVCLVSGLWVRRRAARTDPVRACLVLWGGWLVMLAGVFSVSTTINAYYLAALAPAVAALLGTGAVLAWEHRAHPATAVTVGATVVLSGAYGAWLLPAAGTGLPPWLAPTVVALSLASVAALAGAAVGRRRSATAAGLLAGGLCGLALLAVPAVASASVVADTLGPFDTPFQPGPVTDFTRAFFGAPQRVLATVPTLEAARHGAPYLMATETSVLAAPYIYGTGQEVLPIGGYTGVTPTPTVAALRRDVGDGRFHLVLLGTYRHNRRTDWVAAHCARLPPAPHGAGGTVPVRLRLFYCEPSPAVGGASAVGGDGAAAVGGASAVGGDGAAAAGSAAAGDSASSR